MAILTEFAINPKYVIHCVSMNLNLPGWIVNPRDLKISIVSRIFLIIITLEFFESPT